MHIFPDSRNISTSSRRKYGGRGARGLGARPEVQCGQRSSAKEHDGGRSLMPWSSQPEEHRRPENSSGVGVTLSEQLAALDRCGTTTVGAAHGLGAWAEEERQRPAVLEQITPTGRPAFQRPCPVFPLPAVLESLHGVPVAAPTPAADGPRSNHRDWSSGLPAAAQPWSVFLLPAVLEQEESAIKLANMPKRTRP
jgi:hypothetical protein